MNLRPLPEAFEMLSAFIAALGNGSLHLPRKGFLRRGSPMSPRGHSLRCGREPTSRAAELVMASRGPGATPAIRCLRYERGPAGLAPLLPPAACLLSTPPRELWNFHN